MRNISGGRTYYFRLFGVVQITYLYFGGNEITNSHLNMLLDCKI